MLFPKILFFFVAKANLIFFDMDFLIEVAQPEHHNYAFAISQAYANSAKERGIGIAVRKAAYILEKIKSGKAIIATKDNELAGFCYIETWSHASFVANSGLIVLPKFRGKGLAKQIKHSVFELSRSLYPNSKIFGITTNPHVMRMNAELGYIPVAYEALTQDEAFWKGCQSCPNFEILQKNKNSMCMCTAMLFDKNYLNTITEKKLNHVNK